MFKRLRQFFRLLGPGLVSGGADNDPAGIATYTQVGAQYGYGQLWLAIFSIPLLTAVQEACARVGLVTGHGLAGNIRDHYGRRVLYPVVFLLVVTNTISIGADIGAIAAAARLLVRAPFTLLMVAAVVLMLSLEIFVSYKTYSRYLKWLTVTSLTYLVTTFVVREPWGDILVATVVPHLEWSSGFLALVVGNVGSTLSPYLFFWEASQEAEEDIEHRRIRPDGSVAVRPVLLKRMRIDNAVGMIGSQLITWCIMVVAGTVLHARGVTNLKTAADAAMALEPLVNTFPHAGLLAKLLFAVGIISAGLLVVPVLSASAAYAVAQAAGWKGSLHDSPARAPGFYGVIIVATVVGLVVNFVGIDVIKLLVYTSILNGVAAVPLLFILARIAANPDIMGEYTGGRVSRLLIYAAFVVMLAAVASAVATFRPGG